MLRNTKIELIEDCHAGILGYASDDPELLRQCAASGQMDASQIAQHFPRPGATPMAAPTRWLDLKSDPEPWDEVAARRKTFEIRWNDRDYQVGDGLRLHKTLHTGLAMKHLGLPLVYIGGPLERVVTHVLAGPIYGLAAGWVVLSIAPLAAGQETAR